MSEKVYIGAQDLLDDAFELGARVLASDFRPSFILALWRGAAPIGIAVQEFLAYHEVRTDHIAVRTASYHGIDGQADHVQIFGLNYLVKSVTHEDRLLIVDDVFDTGKTIDAIINEIAAKTRRNCPADIRIAVPYFKPKRNRTDRTPDFFLHETEQWLKFPHSLEGLDTTEVQAHRPAIAAILAEARRP